jgi:hypothetical protein
MIACIAPLFFLLWSGSAILYGTVVLFSKKAQGETKTRPGVAILVILCGIALGVATLGVWYDWF